MVLLDIRSHDEYCKGHLCNAELIDTPILLTAYSKNILYLRLLGLNINKNVRIYVYCKKGIRSKLASDILLKLGYKTVINMGGLENNNIITQYNLCICDDEKHQNTEKH